MHAHVIPFPGSVGTDMYRVGSGYVAYGTKDMELLTISVLYIQGSDAGQIYFKI